jgi:DNA (cytosine-5)-methyltransferase 1
VSATIPLLRGDGDLTVTDQFCGAGGSSTGAALIPGVRIRMAANHWKLAVETHNRNHPGADHDCADISQVDPRRWPRTNILITSPECTNHSQAQGRKRNTEMTPDLFGDTLPDEAAERSRATMWDVPRFAEYHRYDAIIVENVVDAFNWVMFPAWVQAMELLGYDMQIVYLNSMHTHALGAPAPQSRDRMYVVLWRKGNRRPDFDKWTRPAAYCPACDEWVRAIQAWKKPERPWGRYRSQYHYRCPNVTCRNRILEPPILPAVAAIDWTVPGQRIGDRGKPLADKTTARIQRGLTKLRRPVNLDAARHTISSKGITYGPGMVVPMEGRAGKEAASVFDPLRTQTTRAESAWVSPPFIAELRGGGSNERPISQPLGTLTASGTHHGLVVPPLIVPLRTHGTAESVAEPFKTFVAGNVGQALVDTTDRSFIMRNNGDGGAGSGWEATSPWDTFRTLTTTGHQSLVTWLYGYDTGILRSPLDVLPTQTTVDGDALLSTLLEVTAADVDDCLFRMLLPAEIQAGMAFPDTYEVLGNKREKVRLLGNAVTPPAMRDLIAAVAESLGAEVPV